MKWKDCLSANIPADYGNLHYSLQWSPISQKLPQTTLIAHLFSSNASVDLTADPWWLSSYGISKYYNVCTLQNIVILHKKVDKFDIFHDYDMSFLRYRTMKNWWVKKFSLRNYFYELGYKIHPNGESYKRIQSIFQWWSTLDRCRLWVLHLVFSQKMFHSWCSSKRVKNDRRFVICLYFGWLYIWICW